MRTRLYLFASIIILALVMIAGCENVQPPTADEAESLELTEMTPEAEARFEKAYTHARTGKIVIANRASGSISVIDGASDQVTETIDLPPGDNSPEPMYVVWAPLANRVFVGDRANSRVVVYNADDLALEGTVATGAGVFHMWADPLGHKQIWVNNDIDNTTTVIDPVSLDVLATVPTPADLVAQGGKPHDVLVGHFGRYAYVSVIAVAGDDDYVVQFDTRTFQEVGRAAVGNDPHLTFSPFNRNLYVPCQGADEVFVLNPRNLQERSRIPVPNAHGAMTALDGKTFYITNISDGGVDGLFTLDGRGNRVISSIDTPFPVPHNIALSYKANHRRVRADKLYITHSGGTANQVSIYDVRNREPVHVADVTVGLNPFGLAFVK